MNQISLGAWALIGLGVLVLGKPDSNGSPGASSVASQSGKPAEGKVPEQVAHRTKIYVEIPFQGLDRYVRDADAIVRGVVMDQRSVFDGSSIPYTEIDLWALDAVKGPKDRTIRVRVGGARGGDRSVTVVGAPQFVENEEVLLFLQRYGDAGTENEYWGILGFGQGTYRLQLEQGGARKVRGLHASGEATLVELETRLRRELERASSTERR